jgi:hypothetical protein
VISVPPWPSLQRVKLPVEYWSNKVGAPEGEQQRSAVHSQDDEQPNDFTRVNVRGTNPPIERLGFGGMGTPVFLSQISKPRSYPR